MQPTDSFWGGVGESLARSPWWGMLGLVLIIGVLFVVAKYIYPGHKEIKMRELDIRQMEAENARAQVESNRALAEQTRSAGAKVDALVIQNAELAAERKGQVGTGDRAERIRTYNFPQNRLTDHRINLTLYKLDQILDGDLYELIRMLTEADQAEKLKALSV